MTTATLLTRLRGTLLGRRMELTFGQFAGTHCARCGAWFEDADLIHQYAAVRDRQLYAHDTCPARAAGPPCPTDPAALGPWLRALPNGTTLRTTLGTACQIGLGYCVGGPDDPEHEGYDFGALLLAGSDYPFDLGDGDDLAKLTEYAPFTVLRLGHDEDELQGGGAS
ncbi:MAG TPA: hypothetical protein VGM10_31090 [Actinocrinis sp.]|jgi:hypothetical protein